MRSMVPLDVSLQKHFIVERLLAQMAAEGSLLRVDAFVRLECVRALESFIAHRADVLSLIRVHSLVVIPNCPVWNSVITYL